MGLMSVKAHMYYDTRPSDDWTFGVEYQTADGLEGGDIEDITDGIVTGLQAILLDNVVIDRVVWSTFERDSAPYDPANVRTISSGAMGTVSGGGFDPVDDDLTLFIRRNAVVGRSGKIMLRGTIVVPSVTAETGQWTIAALNLGQFQTRVQELWAGISAVVPPVMIGRSLVSKIFPATAEGDEQVVTKVYAAIPHVRAVTGLTLVGLRERQAKQ